jgi:hypothetical protein
MSIGKIIRDTLRMTGRRETPSPSPVQPKKRSELDIYFTSNFHAKAAEWGLTEDHARHVFYQGDPVKGKENMKIATYKGQEIGIYVFRDRDTNQPVITSIWKRPFRGTTNTKSSRGR